MFGLRIRIRVWGKIVLDQRSGTLSSGVFGGYLHGGGAEFAADLKPLSI